ncbi:RloB family protein [Nocardiopsis sp. RSe5-2]|uniref:RloB family protein n=1 Tax=Nocardiopsis endophytica TaxID=3018445 RepID=A0ABT4TWE3_9ACTN|nr:RloB family protein [Nocardiopsis endophytica]MDA2809013.1 RloB family protein [Nocardiopsis endophytica]
MCEGETEHAYFTGLRESDTQEIHPFLPEKAKRPQREKVVDHARKAKSRAEYSQVWAVFDADGHDVRPLCEQAEEGGVKAAVSNPTFEVWLLLHHNDTVSGRSAQAVADELKKTVPMWKKGNGTRFTHFSPGLPQACTRAKKYPPYGNPSTAVWKLMRELGIGA